MNNTANSETSQTPTIHPIHSTLIHSPSLPITSTSTKQNKTRATGGKLKTLYQWHWISSAIALIGLFVFSVTGFTLNHASETEAIPKITQQKGVLPLAVLASAEQLALADLASNLSSNSIADSSSLSKEKQEFQAILPHALLGWLRSELHIKLPSSAMRTKAQWSQDEILLTLPSPGADAWIRIDRLSGEVEFEATDRGWIAYFNDLHKGRHAGIVWRWFIDILALACVVFTISGLLILRHHAPRRKSTWLLVGSGFVIPALLLWMFTH